MSSKDTPVVRGAVVADDVSSTAASSADSLDVFSTTCSCLRRFSLALSLALSPFAHSSGILFELKATDSLP